ncbi:MAG: hypothetical protein OSA89_20560 [Mariniblastus sp.]|nr:hypothetical protein [Mariniblastus sp.]
MSKRNLFEEYFAAVMLFIDTNAKRVHARVEATMVRLNLSKQQFTLLLIAVGVVMAFSIFVSILRHGNDFSKRLTQQSEYRKYRSTVGLLNDTADWPKPFQELHQQLIMSGWPASSMSVCNAMGRTKDGQRIVMCKIASDVAILKVVRQKFGLQRHGPGSKWRMESSSVRGDSIWWPRAGESAIYYANEDFLNGRKAIHFQAAHCEDTVMFVHCTMPGPVPAAKK